jgi:dihydroorotase
MIGDDYDTALKVNPPLRTADDNAALIAAVADGTVDCIATDHAPHTPWEKAREFELAPFGMTGLETSLGLVLTNLIHKGTIDYKRMIELMAVNPRSILGLDRVSIQQGDTADLTVFDPDMTWTVKAEDFVSKASNSGFLGQKLRGRATDTYVSGYATMEEGTVVE